MRETDSTTAYAVIRAGSRADLPELARLWELTSQPDGRFLLRRYFDDVASGIQKMLVGEVGGKIMAQIWVRFRGSDPKFSDDRVQCYLHTLFVHPDCRRRGVGARAGPGGIPSGPGARPLRVGYRRRPAQPLRPFAVRQVGVCTVRPPGRLAWRFDPDEQVDLRSR